MPVEALVSLIRRPDRCGGFVVFMCVTQTWCDLKIPNGKKKRGVNCVEVGVIPVLHFRSVGHLSSPFSGWSKQFVDVQ